MNPPSRQLSDARTRRHFFQDCGIGLGKIALSSLIGSSIPVITSGKSAAAMRSDPVSLQDKIQDQQQDPLAPKAPHFKPTAKRVIFLFMAGAPSQLDLFDHKPKLTQLAGKPIPPSVIAGQRYAFIQPDAAVLPPQFPFAKHGECGAELSDRLPWLAKVVDEIAFVKSCKTDQFNHAPAQLLFNTGNAIPGRPAIGSWLSYGLGSEANDLPSFVVLTNGGLSGGSSLWSSGFLPGAHQGVPFRAAGDPILHVTNPKGIDRIAQRDSLDLIQQLNQMDQARFLDPEIATRINAYEMAFRMQSRAPELMDWSGETKETLEMYGAKSGKASFANNCLLARRLVERGVRFVQVYCAGWDHHSQVKNGVRNKCQETDQASAALILDLKQRGLLEDTVVVWGGEFGRTPMVEASNALGRSRGRDHHPQAFTMWLAGGGIKPGTTLGKTDELGFNIAERPVHVHDVQATLLHCLGLDHEKLTFNHQGLPIRLTGVERHHVIKELLA